MHTFRNNGAIGALLDEYEKALLELKEIIKPLSPENISDIIDAETKDTDCRSIQTILTHVVRSGYVYAIYLRKELGEDFDFPQRQKLGSAQEYIDALDKMFQFNEQVFIDYPNHKLETNKTAKKIHTTWGQIFDGDQMLEHAIVHVLRHRRQIERFIQMTSVK